MKKRVLSAIITSFIIFQFGFTQDQNEEAAAEVTLEIDEESFEDLTSDEDEVSENDETEASENEAIILPEIIENPWQGKIAVAQPDEYPQGIFAMAKGYYPGDTLSVVNEKTHKTTDVLVIGTLDQSDEIGIKFSFEAAKELQISATTDANILLETRINSPDVRENGSAKFEIISNDDYQVVEETEPVKEEVVAVVETTEAVESSEAVENNSESYEPIVLDLPEIKDEVISEVTEVPETTEKSESAETTDVAEIQPVVEEAVVSEPEEKTAPVVKKEEPKPESSEIVKKNPVVEKSAEKKAPVSYKKFIASEKMVRPGYYIQLSFLTNEENLQKFTDKYSDELKLFLIPYKNGFKVFAGVFSEDDKAFALDYVKSLGFKDAFIRVLGK